jgi:hypothetical protein
MVSVGWGSSMTDQRPPRGLFLPSLVRPPAALAVKREAEEDWETDGSPLERPPLDLRRGTDLRGGKTGMADDFAVLGLLAGVAIATAVVLLVV